MSVDYEAFIGIGWVISDQEREDMIEANYVLYKEGKAPCVEDEFYHINAYTGGDVFLGDRIACVDEGEYTCISDLSSLVQPDQWDIFAEKYATIIEACGITITPDSKWANPQLYLINHVW